ncbi:MAG TPA: response regulator transcription factor [Gaiellaceae bacterium]|nr:response regulator transcription factor [Gaiellaceae bacterium]
MEAAGSPNEASAGVVQVLLVTGENPLQDDATAGLAARGFSITRVGDGASAIKSLRGRRVDLVLLDLVLPDVDGIALLTAIRAARPHLPVIGLTASNDESLRLDGFARGADDCVGMPFSIPELTARMEARLRSRESGESVVTAGPLSLDISRNRVAIGERIVPLSPREGSLLAAFLRHAGEVLSREALLRLVWELEFDPHSNIVDVYVAALRRKLGPQVIETIRGRGYRLRVSALSPSVTLNA